MDLHKVINQIRSEHKRQWKDILRGDIVGSHDFVVGMARGLLMAVQMLEKAVQEKAEKKIKG